MLPTARNTRSKRKAAELGHDALDELLAKRRRESRSNTPASVGDAGKGTVEKSGGAAKEEAKEVMGVGGKVAGRRDGEGRVRVAG